ncbi:methyltransferase domain-containing protein [Lysobacter claricitrinus]|uniref:methyltransferase domain-containing protein n=1 Tax=Lysobacter claricitrinus TaxID=3367728 RepID=UPI0037DB48BD
MANSGNISDPPGNGRPSMSLETLAAEYAARYGVAAGFCERYLRDRYVDRVGLDPTDFDASLGPTEKLYLEYAFATNQRGAAALARHPRDEGAPRRVLDIGCGYGGTVRAFADAGDVALGLEIDPQLAEYAALNVEDLPGAEVRCADVMAADPTTLGEFDLIFCSDVIEHVSDPDTLLRAVPRLLAPGGTFVMHVPNKDSIHQVLSDEHFCLFGFTLLGRQEGRELKRQRQKWDDPYHHMGQLLPLPYYESRLRETGLEVGTEVAHWIAKREGALERLGEALKKMEEVQSDSTLSWFTKRALAEAFARYVNEFMTAWCEANFSGDERAFARRFVAPTWTVSAMRVA